MILSLTLLQRIHITLVQKVVQLEVCENSMVMKQKHKKGMQMKIDSHCL